MPLIKLDIDFHLRLFTKAEYNEDGMYMCSRAVQLLNTVIANDITEDI